MAGFGALYILNLRGDPIIQRTYRDDLDKDIPSNFRCVPFFHGAMCPVFRQPACCRSQGFWVAEVTFLAPFVRVIHYGYANMGFGDAPGIRSDTV